MSESKKKGWFSRRHNTSEAHRTAYEAYRAEHGPDARRRKAGERTTERDARSAREQLAILDARLGKNVGASKERDRLNVLAV